MAMTAVSVWFDAEGDFLEVNFAPGSPGYFRETDDDRVMERVSEAGETLGFSILSVSEFKTAMPIGIVLGTDERSA